MVSPYSNLMSHHHHPRMTPPQTTERDRPAFVVDRSTLIPIGLLVAVVISAISATVWINTYLLNLQHQVESLRDEVSRLNQGTWTLTDMQLWVNSANSSKAFPLPTPTPVRQR